MSTEAKNLMTRSSKREGQRDGRSTVQLGTELEKSLSAYASAALAAGVSLLAVTKSTEAKIVYTPADVKIAVNGGPVPLDLNHDGITDFVLSNFFRSPTSSTSYGPSFGSLNVGIGSGNTRNKFWGRGVYGRGFNGRFASALRPGFNVRASKSYFQKSPKGIMARLFFYNVHPLARGSSSSQFTSSTSGQWLYTKSRYLGLQFTISGQVHYGWARVAVARAGVGRGKNSIAATLTGYAYETIPNKPIITGKTKGPDVITLEPAALGHLAQGASGISAWREKK
jgi:hypothetical protein